MATIGNYGAALGDTLKQTAGGIVKGFGYGLKGAALSEVPGLVAGYGAFSALRKNANSIGQAKAALAQGSAQTPASSSSMAGGNPFAQMVQQLAQINANTATAANVAKASAKAEQYKMMFDEEKSREQAQQNQALIDAIKNSGMGGGGKPGEASAAASGGGLLTNILGNALGGMLGTVVMGALLGLRKKLAAFIAELVLSAALLFGGPGGKLGKIAGAIGMGARVAGKIGSRFIPYVGWALLAADVAEAGVAIAGAADKSAKKNANTPNEPMQYDAMGNATGVGPDTSENTKKGNANSPKSVTAQTGANKTSGLLWRVPLTVPYRVSSEFKEKSALRGGREHDGIDLAVGMGNYVVAAADGILVQVSENKTAGIFAIIDHRNGMTSAYCHLSAGLTQKVGQNVKVGDVIGFVGSTGHSTGPHLHFSLKRGGSPVDPRTFIKFGEGNKETAPEAPATAPGGAPKGDAKRGNFDPRKAQRVPGFAAQANKKLTDNAVTAYHKALKEGKSEEEAKAIATKVAGENPEAKAALEKVSATAKSVSVTPVTPVVADAAVVKTSATPLIEMGDAGVAESMQNTTPKWVEAAIKKAAAKGYYTERETNKRTQEVLKELGGIKENTRITAKEVKSNRITMSKGRFKTNDQILAETNKRFTDSLQRQLTKTISGTLMKALYPGGYKNVSQRTASGQYYRGEQLNKMLGLTPALTKLGTSIFGKTYGPAFGQIFSKAATGYMEVGARSVAQGIFGSMGMNSDQANILGGQILGNLAKGTQQGKVTALEQILYGISGGQVALGPETIFAKYGFATPAEGVGYMANVLGAAAMGPIDSALGTTPANMGNMDPRMRTMGAFGGYNGQYGGMPTGNGMPSAGTLQAATQNNPYMQLNKDGMVVLKDNVPQLTKDTADQLNLAKQAEKDAQQRFLDAEGGSEERAIAQKMVSEAQYEQQILTNRLLASRATSGSGTNISIGGGGGSGGFFSGGGSLAEVGNMALDLGKSAITQKVVQSLGIKNPYMGMLASFAVSKGLSYVGGKAFDLFAGTEMGKSVTGALSGAQSSVSNLYGQYAPEWAGGWDAATKAEYFSNAANTTSAGASATSFLDGFNFMEALPYAGAIIKLVQGDIVGAATTAAGVYIGSAIGNMILPGIGGIVGGILGGFIGGLFGGGGGGYTPNPTVWRIIRVNGNNNIAAIVDLQAPKDNPPKEFFDLCDSLIRVGFNATKAAEVETKKPPPFDFIMCTMNGPDGVFYSLRKGDPTSADWKAIALGKADKTFSAGKSASAIVKLITDTFKEAYAADTVALDKASKLLNSKSYGTVSKGLLKELSTGTNKIDVTKDKGVFGGTAAEDAIIMAGRTNTPQAATSDESSSTPPMIWSMKEGKYVEAPFTTKTTTESDGEGGTYQYTRKVYTPNALMYDTNGKLITDTNGNGIDLADIATPTLVTTSGTITGGTTVSTTATGTGTTGNVNVVTNADNSQTNNQSVNTYYTSLLSKSRNAIRDASVNTALPA